MTIELPCMVGDTVFADLRENQKYKPKFDDLTECYIRSIEIDQSYPHFLFTAVIQDISAATVSGDWFGRFWDSDFGKSIFTQEQYFKLK